VPRYSERLLKLPDYPMAAIPAKKRELVGHGVDVIDLGAGDADLAPPAAAVKRRRVLAVLTVAVAIGLFYAARHVQSGDEETRLILAIAGFTNFVGWIVGLLIGTLTTRLRRPRPASGD